MYPAGCYHYIRNILVGGVLSTRQIITVKIPWRISRDCGFS